MQDFWPTLTQAQLHWNWHLDKFCEHLQKVAHRVGNHEPNKHDTLVNVPPGTTKSSTFSVMFPVWCWLNWPWMQFICCSYSSDLSLDHARYSRNVVKSKQFNTYFPEYRIAADQDQKGNYRIECYDDNLETWLPGGYRLSSSVGGTVTGFHGDILIVDDPLNPTESASEKERMAANKWLDRTMSTRKKNKETASTLMIMQRLHQDDCSGHWLSKKTSLFHICLPGEIHKPPDEEDPDWQPNVVPIEWKKHYTDGLLDPIRMPVHVLNQAYEDLGPYGYSSQIAQTPAPEGGGMFKVRKVQILDRCPPISEFGSVIRYWDKAGTSSKDNPDAAFTTGTKMAIHQPTSKVVVMDVRSGQWGVAQREETIKQVAQSDGIETIIWMEQEPGSGGKESAESSIRNLMGFQAYAEKPSGPKVFRAGPLAAQMANSNVAIIRADWNMDWLQEFENFPFSKRNDKVDSASGAFGKLVGLKTAAVWSKSRRGRLNG